MTGVLIRRDEDAERYREDHVKTSGGDGHQQAKQRDFPRRSQPCWLLVLDFQYPELWENKFQLLKLLSVWSFVMTALAEWYNIHTGGKYIYIEECTGVAQWI